MLMLPNISTAEARSLKNDEPESASTMLRSLLQKSNDEVRCHCGIAATQLCEAHERLARLASFKLLQKAVPLRNAISLR